MQDIKYILSYDEILLTTLSIGMTKLMVIQFPKGENNENNCCCFCGEARVNTKYILLFLYEGVSNTLNMNPRITTVFKSPNFYFPYI